MYRLFATLSFLVLLFTSCSRNSAVYGYVRIVFEHRWGDEPVEIDGITPYVNAAGNILTFDNLEYFISRLTISGSEPTVTLDNPIIRYVSDDTAYSTMLLTHQIPTGSYENIRFVFGLDHALNQSNLFSDAPQSNMFWPENMGGGYHFLKLDGKWKNSDEATDQGFGLHLGTLRRDEYDTIRAFIDDVDSIIRIDVHTRLFPQYFPVTVLKSFEIRHQEITTVHVIVDLKQWMENPFTWDFNMMGGAIMSRERAMDSLRTNGQRNLFRH